MSLEEIRQKIDEIDSQLLPLFVERMKCAEEVAKTKMETNLPIFNAQREEQILDKAASRAKEYDCEAKMLYTTMMALSRARQHKMMLSGGETRREMEKALEHRPTLDESSLRPDHCLPRCGRLSLPRSGSSAVSPSGNRILRMFPGCIPSCGTRRCSFRVGSCGKFLCRLRNRSLRLDFKISLPHCWGNHSENQPLSSGSSKRQLGNHPYCVLPSPGSGSMLRAHCQASLGNHGIFQHSHRR